MKRVIWRPRIRVNDYGAIGDLPELGEWTPSLAVSVVIPAYRAGRTLPLTLAGLAAQSYPSHLMEVIVVDDGEEPMDRLPEIVPERTRLIRPPAGSWGKANACNTGAEVADGHVIHWLDADLLLFRHHVEAQMRWHHLADYLVVLGHLRFVERDLGPDPDGRLAAGLDAGEVIAAVEAEATGKLFGEDDGVQQWTEKRWDATSDLREAGPDAFSVHVGATSSMPAELFRTAGGMDRSLTLGEDTELGYRLAQAGAVFVPDRGSRCWHLGSSTVMRREKDVKRHNWPHLAERVPTYRWLRRHPQRGYLVPYVEVVVHVGDASFEDVRATVDGVLASWTSDIVVRIVAPWGRLSRDRRDPLGDPFLDLRLIRANYEGEPRVSFPESVPELCFPTPFRLSCPPGWVPAQNTLKRITEFADRNTLGVLALALDEQDEIVHARLERTAALSRAHRIAEADEDVDDVVHEIFGTLWDAGEKWGIVRSGLSTPTRPERLVRELKKSRARAAKWETRAKAWRRKATRKGMKRKRLSAKGLTRKGLRMSLRRISRSIGRRVGGLSGK